MELNIWEAVEDEIGPFEPTDVDKGLKAFGCTVSDCEGVEISNGARTA
jgi:hypothetical protein